MKTVKYGDLLNLAREKDRVNDLYKQVYYLSLKLSIVLGEEFVVDCLKPIKMKLLSIFIRDTAEYKRAFDEYFKDVEERINP